MDLNRTVCAIIGAALISRAKLRGSENGDQEGLAITVVVIRLGLFDIVPNWPRQGFHVFRTNRGESSDYLCDKRIAVYVEALKVFWQQRDKGKRHRAAIKLEVVACA